MASSFKYCDNKCLKQKNVLKGVKTKKMNKN
jgi:hypothetical protein